VSLAGGCDDFELPLLLVINSVPTSINSSRFDELLEVVSENDGNDFVGFNGSDDIESVMADTER